MSRKTSRNRMNHLRPLAALLAAGLGIPAVAQSVPFPNYQVGPQANGTYVVSDGTIITPAGTQVDLGVRVRAKAIALNPTGNHTAAVLTMGTSPSNGNGAVEIFDTQTGKVLQSYSFNGKDSSGSEKGIAYTPDGKHLLFSQDSSHVTIAKVSASGMLSDDVQVSVPMAVNSAGVLTTVTCFPNSPPGTTGSNEIPCGQTYTIASNGEYTSYPLGLAISSDGKTAYSVLDVNNQLAKIDLTAKTPTEGKQIRVGNVPNSVIISPDGKTAYVSNEAGRIATRKDFQQYSDGTPVVAIYPTGATATGTLSVVDLASFRVTDTISTGLHPTGMAFYGSDLLVANTYSNSISVIDPGSRRVVRTINLALPFGVPGRPGSNYGTGPNSIAVDAANHIAYVALYYSNAIGVVDLRDGVSNPIIGMIPVAYAPANVVLDKADNVLLVANDKGIGTKGIPPQNSFQTSHGVTSYGTHQDLGTVSIVPIPNSSSLDSMTDQVYANNHWDLAENIFSASGGRRHTRPVAIPERIGDPSLIKHVFVIIRENRTYDQILGDVRAGNGDPSLAVFGDNATYGPITPNAHALVKRFPLLDNFYDPSRQSADGHNWIMQAMAPYHDDIQSPDWVRDYPSNGGDAIAYQKQGNLYDLAAAAGLNMKNYGEYVEYNTFLTPTGSTTEPSWLDFYNDAMSYENHQEPELYYWNTIRSHSPLPDVINYTVQNFPQFDLNIPDQYRVDVWKQDFKKDVANGTVPQLSFLWIMCDHTGGPPTVQAEQADNDLAVGRIVDYISHSSVWSSSAIFIEEDDAQDGVDHVDGHRSPGYVISPYVRQHGYTDSTYWSQVNMTRTIEQILGLKPMNQSDLVASPMRTLFIDNPPKDNFKVWTHVPNQIPLDQGVTASSKLHTESPAVQALRAAWMKKKAQMFASKMTTPDAEDPDTLNHFDWYEATGFTRPYPGEKTVRPPSEFNRPAPAGDEDEGSL